MPTLTQEPIAVAGEPPVVSHGEVIAPDFSNFLLLDKAAACFRSSLFLALKKKCKKDVLTGSDTFSMQMQMVRKR